MHLCLAFYSCLWLVLVPAIADADSSVSHVKVKPAGHSVKQVHKPKAQIGEDQAIDMVSKQPEVKQWILLLRKTKGAGTPSFSATREGGSWSVQVSESFPAHNATFGWYSVNIRSKKISKSE